MKHVINFFALIGFVLSISLSYLTFTISTNLSDEDKLLISKVETLDKKAIPTYINMFKKVLNTGDAAKGMVLNYPVESGVTNEDVAESISALAEEHNMILTGDVKMFTNDKAVDKEIKHARIFSVCSLTIAKQFLVFSPEFGGFMPCRIMLVEFGDGSRVLYTMDLALMIYGGKTLPPKMLELSLTVKNAMEDIPSRAAIGDF